VPENEFTQKQKVTLRRILSHTAGLTVHGFPGYDIDEPVPTVVQVLNGEPPANTEPVRVDTVPGTKWRYSGGGTVIAQQLMVDVTGTPFPQLMREILFDKIGMQDSTFEQPLPPEKHAMAASGTHWDGTTVHGKWHIYPEMAAAGLWSTASDLAKFAIEIALSQKGFANHVLSQSTAREMLSTQTEWLTESSLAKQENPPRMGLGFFLGDESGLDLFGHTGDDAGFQAMLTMDSGTGQGAAIMTNSEFGSLLYDYLADNIAQEYNWKSYGRADHSSIGATTMLMAIALSRGIQAALTQYQTLKEANLPRYTPDEDTLIMFGYLLLANQRSEDALEVLKLQVHDYPQFWNGYDTLAEVYKTLGETQLAIQNYEKSVELNPDNQFGIERLRELNKPIK
jgi:CubicO group peptidase (beta-lactamase class C family)